MKRIHFLCRAAFALLVAFGSMPVSAQSHPDPNFHIYLCFGQSNMEGNAPVVEENREGVSPRMQTLCAVSGNYGSEERKMGEWYEAKPPLCVPSAGLTPVDYCGRYLVSHTPDSVRFGFVVVAIGGASINAFDEDKCESYYASSPDWLKSKMDAYDRNPYRRLVDMGRQAQQRGVIKGILLQQGETDCGQADWPQRVKVVYDRLLADLGLAADSCPLFAGETMRQEQGGKCWSHNAVVDTLAAVIPQAQVVSSENCEGNGVDGLHFSNKGYQTLGLHYGEAILEKLY